MEMLKTVLLAAPPVLLLLGCDVNAHHVGPIEHQAQSVDMGKFENARLELKMGAGELRLEGGSPKLVDADFAYNVPTWKPYFNAHVSGFRADVRVSQNGGASFGSAENTWEMKINDNVPWDIITHLGAGEAHMELGSAMLRKIEVHMGVGELRLDLRGNPKRSYDIEIHGGVGEADITLPKSAAIFATAHGGIGDISVDGLEKHGDHWVNKEAEKSPVTVRLDAHGGVGSIKIAAE